MYNKTSVTKWLLRKIIYQSSFMKERHNELTMNEEQFSKRVSNSNFSFLFARKIQRNDNKINLNFYSLNT